MTHYTLVTTRPSGGRSTYVFNYPTDALIIADAQQVLGEDVMAIAIARGTAASGLQWLGAWRLDGEARWNASNVTPFRNPSRRRARRLAEACIAHGADNR